MSVLLSLGSNLEPRRHLAAALDGLAARLAVTATSPVYESEAVGGPPASPPFLNAALEVRTALSPEELKFGLLRPLEADLGRVRRDDPDAPRTIDVDIALFGDLVLDEPERALVVPDPEILERGHVALPLADIAPERRHPVTGETLERIAARWRGAPGIRRVADDLAELVPTRSSG